MPSDTITFTYCVLCRERVDDGFEGVHRGEMAARPGIGMCPTIARLTAQRDEAKADYERATAVLADSHAGAIRMQAERDQARAEIAEVRRLCAITDAEVGSAPTEGESFADAVCRTAVALAAARVEDQRPLFDRLRAERDQARAEVERLRGLVESCAHCDGRGSLGPCECHICGGRGLVFTPKETPR